MNELLLLLWYLPWSAAALSEGTLPLPYCAGRFAEGFLLGACLVVVTLLILLLREVRRLVLLRWSMVLLLICLAQRWWWS